MAFVLHIRQGGGGAGEEPGMRGSGRGYTVVELLVAIVLVVILAGVSIPVFTAALQNRRLDGAVRKIVGDLRYAQSLAVAQGGLYRLHSGDEPGVNQPGRYRLERSTDGGSNWGGVTSWYDLSSEFQGAGISSIQDSAGSPLTIYEVRFNSRGACANCSTLTPPIVITVSGASGTRTIQVRSTGSVRIQ